MGISQRDCIVFFAKIMKQNKKQQMLHFQRRLYFPSLFSCNHFFLESLEITQRHKSYDNIFKKATTSLR